MLNEKAIPGDSSINVRHHNLVIVVPIVESTLCSSCTLHVYKHVLYMYMYMIVHTSYNLQCNIDVQM